MALLVACFTGCGSLSSIRADVEAFDLDHIRTFAAEDLADAYYDYRESNRRAAGKSRLAMMADTRVYYLATPEAMAQMEQVLMEKGLTEREIEAARGRRLFISMSRAALFASVGKPYRETARWRRERSVCNTFTGPTSTAAGTPIPTTGSSQPGRTNADRLKGYSKIEIIGNTPTLKWGSKP